jgi:hypothetical protein
MHGTISCVTAACRGVSWFVTLRCSATDLYVSHVDFGLGDGSGGAVYTPIGPVRW